MRWKLVLLAIPVFAALLASSACGLSIEDAVKYQEKEIGIDEIEEAARNAGSETEYGVSLNDGLAEMWCVLTEEADGIFRSAVRSGVLILVIVLLCGLVEIIYETAGKGDFPLVPLAGTLGIAAATITDVNSMLGLGRSTIENMVSFANALLPTVAAVTAATGSVTGAAVRQMSAAVFSDLLVNVIDWLVVPAIYGYLAAAIAHAALGNEGLKRISGIFKWGATWVLTAVLVLYVGYLSISGVVAGSADAAAIKAAKFTISGAIPVVGGILSDAADTILASAGILKGTVGVFGMLVILGACLTPLLRLAIHYLVYKLVAALTAVVGSGRVSGLVDQIGSAFGVIFGMTGACSLLLLVSLVTSISVVSA